MNKPEKCIYCDYEICGCCCENGKFGDGHICQKQTPDLPSEYFQGPAIPCQKCNQLEARVKELELELNNRMDDFLLEGDKLRNLWSDAMAEKARLRSALKKITKVNGLMGLGDAIFIAEHALKRKND